MYAPGKTLTKTAACILLGTICSCAERQPLEKLDDYLNFLSHSLKTAFANPTPATVMSPPGIATVRVHLPVASFDHLNVSDLKGCALQITLNKFGSSLGKFASDSQRLLLSLEYLLHAPGCVLLMRQQNKRELAEILEQAYLLVQQQLPARIFNATLGGIEFRQLWLKPHTLGYYPNLTNDLVLSSIAAIVRSARRWMTGDYGADNREFEIQLSEVAQGDGGALWLALAEQASHLEAASRILKARLRSHPKCPSDRNLAEAGTLYNATQKYFIAELQPWSSDLTKRYHQLMPSIMELEELLKAAQPTAYIHWKVARDHGLLQLAQAPVIYAELLQTLMAPCPRPQEISNNG